MPARIRWLAIFFVLCFALLFLQLNNLQVRQANQLTHNKLNPTNTVNVFEQARGSILTADGTVIARSQPSAGADKEQRIYPDGALYAAVTGYYDISDEADPYGIEAEYDQDLQTHASPVRTPSDILVEQDAPDDVVTTIDSHLQQVAATALAGRTGAVIVIRPDDGAVLALYANPTYDPNLLASHNKATVDKAFKAIASDGYVPLDAATRLTFAPGSTFKIVTTAALLTDDLAYSKTRWPVVSSITLPLTTQTLSNFDHEACGGDLAQVLAKSCDTSYGLIGMKIGGAALAGEAASFGFNSTPPLDLPSAEVATSVFPPASTIGNGPLAAYSAIGQYNDTASVLQMGLVAAGIADHGTVMSPHLLDEVLGRQGQVIERYAPHRWLKATTQKTARTIRNLMLGVTRSGTAAGIFPPDLQIAAKTGTAEVGPINGCGAESWFVAFGPAGVGQTAKAAVAVVLPYQPGEPCDVTGAEVAGPVARDVLLAALGSAS